MIDPKELMIGNYVYWDTPEKKDVFHKVVRIRNNSIQTTPISMPETLYDLLPIPLTPEILAKCGFVKETDSSTHYHVGYKLDFYANLSGEKVCLFIDGSASNVDVIHLHTLQNLVKLLTNTPLKVDL